MQNSIPSSLDKSTTELQQQIEIPSAQLAQNHLLHAVNRHYYRPTKRVWQILIDETDLEPYCSHSQVEGINFESNKIHLKGGARLSFTGLSEQKYLGIVSGF